MAAPFDFQQRQLFLKNFASQNYDLIIVGGGISGAGVARDAASRGMKVALVEARDFAEGTSSRSSKLIHGGLRYLEGLEFCLVFEALRERELLFRMAPHMVHPLRFLVPLYSSSRVSLFKMRLGLWLYEALSLFNFGKRHRVWTASVLMEYIPTLKKQGLVGGVEYSDAYMDDDRLVLETLRSAYVCGAESVNYVKAEKGLWVDGKLSGLECIDQKTGVSVTLRGSHIISTVGPWTDDFGSAVLESWKKVLRPSKGIHIVIEKDRIPIDKAVVMAAEESHRIVFAIPRNDMFIIGTTDTDYKEAPEDVCVMAEDVAYLLNAVNQYFPGAKITEKDIVSSYAGVRPLICDQGKDVGKVSREHVIIHDERNITFMAGGKYTTYRKMAEDVVASIMKYYPTEKRVEWSHGQTKRPLNARITQDSISLFSFVKMVNKKHYIMSEREVQTLVFRHGPESKDLVESCYRRLQRPVTYWECETNFAIEQTMCTSLEDFFFRRTPLFIARRDHGLGVLEEIAAIFAMIFHWTPQELERHKQCLESAIQARL